MQSEELVNFLSKISVCSICFERFIISEDNLINSIKNSISKEFNNINCNVCLGLLQDNFLNEIIRNVKINSNINEYCDYDEFQCTIAYPKSLIVREHLFKLLLKKNFPQYFFQNEYQTISKISRTILAQKLSLVLNKTHRNIYDNSQLNTFITIDFSVTCDDLQLLQQLENLDPNYYENRKIQKRKFQKKLFTKKSISLLLSRVDDDTFLEYVKFPIDQIKLSIKSISIRRNPIYFGARYLKFSRKLPQSPWSNQNNEYYNTSIQELIFNQLLKYINTEIDQMTFSASGREDIDVRCLGNGRPFVIEIRNPRIIKFSESKMKELEIFLNSSTNLIEILNLQVISNSELKKLKEGEEHKSKTYNVYCISEKHLESLKPLNDFIKSETGSIEIEQKTPIRVLHRRSLEIRKKKIFELSAEFCPGSSNQFLLKVCSQAGTYIKEFVHSDFGRTNPSVSSILESNISVAALDVIAINFDWLTNNTL